MIPRASHSALLEEAFRRTGWQITEYWRDERTRSLRACIALDERVLVDAHSAAEAAARMIPEPVIELARKLYRHRMHGPYRWRCP